jgi:hypothetical protein
MKIFASKSATSPSPKPLTPSARATDTAGNLQNKDKKDKRNNEQPTHKTTHLEAPTHKPMVQLVFLPAHPRKLIHL